MRVQFLFFALCSFTSLFSESTSIEEKLQKLLPSFENYAEEGRKDWDIPGMAIAIVGEDKVFYSKSFGVRELGGAAIDANTLFQIGSLSKAFTATLVGMMVDEGKLKWDDPVVNYYPSFMMQDPWVTRAFEIEDLLAQRSGLPKYAGDTQAIFGFDPAQILKNLRYINPQTSFRSAYAYQNVFFLLAGEILKNVTATPWSELVKKRIFDPLQMNESSATLEGYKNAKNRAWLYVRVDGKTEALPKNFPYLAWNYTYGPAGGINCTILDMSKWIQFQLHGGKIGTKEIISKENLSPLYRPHIFAGEVFDSNNYYCLGWVNRDFSPYPIIWHDGGTSGVSNIAAFIPEEKIGIIVFTNVKGAQLNYALAWKFFDLLYQKEDIDWNKVFLDKQKEAEAKAAAKKEPLNPSQPLSLANYAGTYSNAMYGDAEVRLDSGNLFLFIGPNKLKLPLTHWDRDIFLLTIPEMNEEKGTKVLFSLGSSGLFERLIIDMLEDNSDGTFQRKF